MRKHQGRSINLRRRTFANCIIEPKAARSLGLTSQFAEKSSDGQVVDLRTPMECLGAIEYSRSAGALSTGVVDIESWLLASKIS